MTLSTDIKLPRSFKAEFPNRCVVCDCPNPNSRALIITGSIGWWTWTLWWMGSTFMVKPPACTGCAWKLQASRMLSLLITIAIAVAFMWLVWPFIESSVPRVLRKWVAVGLILICALPQFIVELLYAPAFDVTAYAKSVTYEFRSQSYAMDFAMHNLDADWVKLNDISIKSK